MGYHVEGLLGVITLAQSSVDLQSNHDIRWRDTRLLLLLLLLLTLNNTLVLR